MSESDSLDRLINLLEGVDDPSMRAGIITGYMFGQSLTIKQRENLRKFIEKPIDK